MINPIKISRILHAGYLFEAEGFRIAFDPLFESPFSQNCYAFPAVEFDTKAIQDLKFDAIFISHYHDDHFSMESLNLLDRNIPIYIFSIFEELTSLLTELGFKNVHSIQILRPITVGPFEILPLEALDADVDSIYHIKAFDLNILHVVDSWIGLQTFYRLLATITWDLVLWPFQTMREFEVIAPSIAEEATRLLPFEWLEQLQQLNPKAIIPSSCQFQFEEWSWHNKAFFPISYEGFSEQVHKILPHAQIQKLNPGQSLVYEDSAWKPEGRLSWIKPIGNQDLDYSFDPSVKPQPVSEIAKKFSSLSSIQKNFIHTYCQTELLKKYTALNFSEESSFAKPQFWRLRIYAHDGMAQDYQYKIFQNQIQLEPTTDQWTWLTEISEAKLYSALTDGESLTSIYIRVTPANPVDPLEDPLIRCLYEGLLGSYQKAQLKKLAESRMVHPYETGHFIK